MICNNNTETEFTHSVVIPIDPKVIICPSPNMESNAALMSGLHGNQHPGTPRNNNKQTDNGNKNRNNNNGNNSNGNGDINKQKLSNNPEQEQQPQQVVNTSTSVKYLDSSDYSQSPFNPLLSMTQSDFTDTPQQTSNENEELSLASNHFKLFVQETLKKVSNNQSDNLKARLIIPSNSVQGNNRWGLKISGTRADLVLAAKKEIMRSPCMMETVADCDDDEVDMETSLRTSRTIESLLFEGDSVDEKIREPEIETAIKPNMNTIDFPVLASLSGLIMGPKHHVIKSALANYNCTIDWDSSLSFIPTNSSLNLSVSGSDSKAVASVVQILKDRSDRINELPLAVNTLVIEAGKLDWIYSSGAIKHVEEALWKCGATLTQISETIYQVTCLTGALLNSFLKRIHEILSRHQSVHFTFRFRNDFRDFSTKCAHMFESLAHATDCSISQKCVNGNCVEVEIGGSSRDLARALIRLETYQSQIFESGSNDLKLVERRLRLSAPAEIREFVSGKKDGKLNRIIKETGVNISLNMIGGDSMYVELLAEDPFGVNFCSNALLHALRLIEGELPAELTFHVPEVHHKRMIGHGGKVIQRIMKKWGVYVKFMNSHETSQCNLLSDPLDPFYEHSNVLDNVVVKTPSKNASALKAINEEIFEECSVSEINGTFDHESFKSLKRLQASSKSRVSVSLPSQHRPALPNLLKSLKLADSPVQVSLMRGESDKIILEGEKTEICGMISMMAVELKNEISYNGEDGEIIVKSPKSTLMKSPSSSMFSSSSSPSLSDASFKFFASALFVVQSHQSISASGSPLLSSDSLELSYQSSPACSIAMNSLSASLNSSPPLPVGHQKKVGLSRSGSEEVNFALAETRRRSADILL